MAWEWPKEYGGQARSPIEQLIFKEEFALHGAPGYDLNTCAQLAPTLILFGTEEQKRQHLDPISRGEVIWCIGFSEPGAGSDLASLQTRAVREGDEYVLNGQKVWTSGGHLADWMFLVARTDPDAPKKHHGLTCFITEMNRPGITVRPLISIDGLHTFNEVYFDDVRLPKENMLGEENRGWYVTAQSLDMERNSVYYAAGAKRFLNMVIRYAKETEQGGKVLAKNLLVRHKLAELAIETEVGRMMSYRIAWMETKGIVPNYEASMTKVFTSETCKRITATGMELMGLYGQLERGSKWVPVNGFLKREYLSSVAYTIEAGTSEIQRSVIAQRGLGLPRDR